MRLGSWLGRRFSRLATDLVVRWPWLWRFLRRPLALLFDRLAPRWSQMRSPTHLAPLEAALAEIGPARHVLDLGTGTGAAAVLVAGIYPEAEVTGVDLAPGMVEEARRALPPELDGRVRFEIADSAALPFADGAFDLVVLLNMIPFFDELARVLARDGRAVFAFSNGAGTPIYVSAARLRSELGRRRFTEFAEISAGNGTALIARRG